MIDDAARIAAIACQALAADPGSSQAVEAALRRELGGQRVRIEPRAPVTIEAIDAGLRAGKVVRVIARDLGVSRSTLYRHIDRARKSRRAAACDTEAP